MSNNINQTDATLTEIEQKVFQVISLLNRPVTIREISKEMNIPLAVAREVFHSLEEKGNIVAYASEQAKSQYYTPTASKTGLDALLSQKYVDMVGPLEKQYEDIKAENENLKQQVNKLYANILTLMGIFVAIFSLIVINVNAIGTYVITISTSEELFGALVKLNIPLTVAIVVLVLLIRFVLLPRPKRANFASNKDIDEIFKSI